MRDSEKIKIGQPRIQWIDCAKAFAIILVVFGHTVRDGYAQRAVYGFHVPLFFLTAGMSSFFSEEKRGKIKKDFCRILIPYFIWGVLSICIYAVLGKLAQERFGIHTDLSIVNNLGGLLFASTRNNYMQYNLPLWFLPCLFVTKLQFYAIMKLFRNRKALMLGASVLIAALGYLYSAFDLPYLPCSLEISVKMLPFFMAGNFLMSNGTVFEKAAAKRSIAGVIGLLLLCVVVFLSTLVDRPQYHLDNFPCVPVFLINAVLGSCGVILISICIEKCSWLSYLGRNTLAILVMHKFPVLLFQMAGPFADVLNDGKPLGLCVVAGIIVSAIAIGACLIAAEIVMKICPFALTGRLNFSRKT